MTRGMKWVWKYIFTTLSNKLYESHDFANDSSDFAIPFSKLEDDMVF